MKLKNEQLIFEEQIQNPIVRTWKLGQVHQSHLHMKQNIAEISVGQTD